MSITFSGKAIAADFFIGKDINNAEWYLSGKVRNSNYGKLAWVTIINSPESSGVKDCSSCGGKIYYPPKSNIQYLFDCNGNVAQIVNVKYKEDGSVFSRDDIVSRFSSIAPNTMTELIEAKVCGSAK